MTDDLTPEQIAQFYSAMGDSVWLISAIIAGDQFADASEEEKRECVERNARHLEIMRSKDFWTDEDFEAVDDAIAAGRIYLAQ